MVDFAPTINFNDFLYRRKVYYKSPYSELKQDIIVKLLLTEENFNFDLAQSDGRDFRLTDGVDTLRMWVAHWSKTNKHAVLFFKLHNVGPGASEQYDAYWGNDDISMNSEPDKMGFPFYEDFNGSSLDTSKWSGGTSNGFSSSFGYLISNNFTTKTNPLLEKFSWVLEAGIYGNWSTSAGWNSGDRATGFGFTGTENNVIINIMHSDRIEHQAIEPGGSTYSYSIKTHGGLEGYSQNDIYISYYEPEDKITIKLQNRQNFNDTEHTIQRKVEGDTRPSNITVYSRESSSGSGGANPNYISWLIIRDYDEDSLSSLDGSELYISYETILAQSQDYREYGPDITNITYEHESDFGGDPYLLSNDQHDADSNVWISDQGAASETKVSSTIHLGWSKEQLVKKGYKHYDSSHVYYYNASKLSDQDLDKMGRNYWHCTTSSGWAAIKFDSSRNIGAFRVKFYEDSNTAPKDYAFVGSNFYPGAGIHLGKVLRVGTFDNVFDWQSVKLNSSSRFKYFILDIKNTYGDQNIKIQEWKMFDNIGNFEKFYPAQIRLHPGIYGSFMENFPKEIMFEGSVDGVNWVTLIPWTFTYTPYVNHYYGEGYWQRYSFVNNKGFWSFRLSCRGNWGAEDGKIIIGEWSIHELSKESYTYRVLGGTSNNIQQIWAQEGTTLEDTQKMFFAANEEITSVVDEKSVNTIPLPYYYDDFNVI